MKSKHHCEEYEREQLEGCYVPVRRANLFNIAEALFESRQQVWAKAIKSKKKKKSSVTSDEHNKIERNRNNGQGSHGHHHM